MLQISEIEKKLIEAIKKAETELPADVVSALKKAREREDDGSVARIQFDAILKNIELSKAHGLPLCQDTGTQTFFVELGMDFKETKLLKSAIINAVRKATDEIPLRPNTVDPFTGSNPGDNTGRFVPHITWELVDGAEVVINVLPKGGGGENMSTLGMAFDWLDCWKLLYRGEEYLSAMGMLKPAESIEGAKQFIVDHVVQCGGKPCPPTVLGVGIGGGPDLLLKLAKKALLRKIGERHPDPKIAKLEDELLETINSTGIGPMGLGGKTTSLDVHIEWAHRHPASFPVGIITQCWANRRAQLIIRDDGSIEVY